VPEAANALTMARRVRSWISRSRLSA